MALINCKECGQEISDLASSCPHCGAPVERDVYCPKCGTKVSSDTGFCPHCGSKIALDAVSPAPPRDPNAKDKLVTGLFAIILGEIGLHYFYLGKATAGVLTIVLTLVTCGIWYFITLIQGILMLVMTEEEFQAKYVNTDKTMPLF